MSDLARALPTGLSIAEAAHAHLGDALYRYVLGIRGEGEDATATAFSRYRLIPRLMTGQAGIDIRVSFAGQAFAAPLAVGAFAGDRVLHGAGLLPVARVCQRLGLPLMISEETVTPLADIAAAHDGCWLQLRAAGALDRARRLAEAAARCGVKGIIVTALAPAHPTAGSRPGEYSIRAEIAARGWSTIGAEGALGIGSVAAWPQWGWADIRALAADLSSLGLPLIVKGVLRPEDAAAAVEAGCQGVIVSNIGLRQCSRWALPLDCLAEIRAAAAGTVMLDGGIRSGVDALVACCLGADMVVAVRPVVTALAGGGEVAVLGLLRGWLDEMIAVASWLGVGRLDELDASYLKPRINR
jgi:4-hydroxymandelate oxidase